MRYRRAAQDLLIHWIENNPVGFGVNWTIAMEAALRAISICLFLEFVSPPATMDSWWLAVTKSLWQHLIFIEAHIEFSHFARGNHYLSNVVALFCLSSFLHGPGMTKRQHVYRKLIEREMLLQVYKDGGDFEASTGYHLLNLQMFTTAFLLIQRQQMPMCSEFADGLRRMYSFLSALSDCRGRVPHLGDCDDGRVELLSDDLEQMFVSKREDRYSLTVSGQLGLGQALLGERYDGHNKDVVWYGFHAATDQEVPSNTRNKRSLVFSDSGIVIGRQDALEVVFLAMPNGMKGKGTHTHNDKLSLVAHLHGQPLFIDSGTGCYSRDAKTRNQFRATTAHNTIRMDGQEQNQFSTSNGSIFIIGNDARVSPVRVEEDEQRVLMSASHDGYGRLGVIHKRTVELARPAILTINDYLTGIGYHTFEMCFHLHPRWYVEIVRAEGRKTQCYIKDGSITLELMCEAAIDLKMTGKTAEVSPAYGLVIKSKVVVVQGGFETMLPLLSRLIQTA